MLETYIREARELLEEPGFKARERSLRVDMAAPAWPRNPNQIILQNDTAVELGPSQMASVSVLLATGDKGLVHDGSITLVGPDIPECNGREMAFGKLVLVQVRGLDDDNLFERCQEMNMQRLSLNLLGYAPRAIPQKGREWSRISKKALGEGFSFEVLGTELYRELCKLDYVDAAELVFITSNTGDVERFGSLAQRVGKTLQALDKMGERLAYDCASCDYRDVCDEVDGLREKHRRSLK